MDTKIQIDVSFCLEVKTKNYVWINESLIIIGFLKLRKKIHSDAEC